MIQDQTTLAEAPMTKKHPIRLNLCPIELAEQPWASLEALANATLDEEEAARVTQLKAAQEEHQARRFILTRWFLRHSLSNHFGDVTPQDWRFQRGPHGKPAIANTKGKQREFNLSHSQTHIAVASGFTPLGVDVEQVLRKNNTTKIAQRYFSELELNTLAIIPESEKALYFARLWTLKEAYAKCLGLSLFDVIKTAQFQFDAQGNIELSDERGGQDTNFQFFQTVIHEDCCLSICWECPDNQSEAIFSVALQNTFDSAKAVTLNWSSSR